MNEENERLYEEAQRRLREVTTLYEASQACLSISDQKGLLTAIIEAAAQATDATLGSVMLVDEEKGEYIFGAHYGLSQETIAAIEAELHIPLGDGLVGSVVTTGQPLVVADVTTDPRWILTEMKELMRSFLGVPLVGRDGQPLGALNLARPEVDAFDENHARLLSTFANQAAMAIENARLYEQAQQEITERKRALEALRESEERYRRLVELSFDAIAIHSEGKVVYINATGAELFGASSPEALIGKPILDLVHPDCLEIAEARMLRAKEGKVMPLIEEKLIRLDGTSLDAEVVGIPIIYQGQPAMQVVVRDITERKRTEEALRESEERFRQLAELSPFPVSIIDSDGRYEYVNPKFVEVFGYTLEDIPNGKEWFAQAYPDSAYRQDAISAWLSDLKQFRKYEARPRTFSVTCKDGTVREILFRPVTIKDGKQFIIYEDITERRRAEEALQESELQYRTTLDSMGDAIHVVDTDLRFALFNMAFKRWNKELGLEMDVIGRTVFEVFPFLPDKVRDEYHRVFDTGKTLITEESTKIGSREFVTETRKIPVFEGGRVLRVVTVIRDITARKRAEKELRESEEKYSNLFHHSNDGIFLHDLEGNIIDVNQKVLDQFGYTEPEILSLKISELHPPEALAASKDAFERISKDGFVSFEIDFKRKSGDVFPAEVSSSLFELAGEKVIQGIVRDITERKKLEEQLRQAQKMEAIGTLAGGIAHDFNNLLTPIGGFAELLMWKIPEDSQEYEYLRQIRVAAERAAALTRQLLAFARRARVEVRLLSLNDVAREVIGLLRRTIDKAIAIELHLADDLATVEGDAGQLHQVLLNLCLNARDAMPQGGQLIIETQNVTLSASEACTELNLEAGQYVLLSVTDTGGGMDAETQQRLFEPFFTTKEEGRGLGLAMVYGIVRGHRGTIHVYSEPGQGSTFKVYLPIASRLAEDTAPEEAEVVGGTETVLVVDDEESVRALLRRILEEGGYTVLLAVDGVEAMELYNRPKTEIDLVVLDIVMPRMGGRETYERLREINPGVKVLLSSGYSENGQAQDILAAGARGFLQKPYDLRAVLRKVREALEG